jgi:hypothetical protein
MTVSKPQPLDHLRPGCTLSRRGVLTSAAAVAGAALLRPTSAHAAPTARLTGAAARRVDSAQFLPAAQMRAWQEAVDDIGLRATGSKAHHDYISRLAARMQRSGLQRVRTDRVPFRQWLAEPGYALDVLGGPAAGAVRVASYVPYSGSTGPRGVVGTLTTEPTAGAIGLATATASSLPYALFDGIDYDAPLAPRHPAGYNPLDSYQRSWLASGSIIEAIEAHRDAGARAVVVILDVPYELARGHYGPYDGVIRGIPALFVDRETGARLQRVAEGKGQVRLKLEARTADVTSPNVYGVIPGRSEELVIVQSHTDGTNGIEENGPEGMLAMIQYLARIPRHEVARSILFVATTGHMAGHAMGTDAFMTRHRDGLVSQTAAAISIEHLGSLEYLPDADGVYHRTGRPEVNITFSSPHTRLVQVGRRVQQGYDAEIPWVLRPFQPDHVTDPPKSPNGFWWPGDGESLWRVGHLPSLQSIAGPSYLLAGGMNTMPFFDAALMRRQCIAFTNAVLELARTPRAALAEKRRDDPGPVQLLVKAADALGFPLV